jgi:hypothetical protein
MTTASMWSCPELSLSLNHTWINFIRCPHIQNQSKLHSKSSQWWDPPAFRKMCCDSRPQKIKPHLHNDRLLVVKYHNQIYETKFYFNFPYSFLLNSHCYKSLCQVKSLAVSNYSTALSRSFLRDSETWSTSAGKCLKRICLKTFTKLNWSGQVRLGCFG